MKCLFRCFLPKGGEVRRKNHLVSNSIPSTNRVWLRFTRFLFLLLQFWSVIPLDVGGLQADQDSLVPKRQLGSFFLGNLPIHVFVLVFTRLLLMAALLQANQIVLDELIYLFSFPSQHFFYLIFLADHECPPHQVQTPSSKENAPQDSLLRELKHDVCDNLHFL